MLSGIVGCPLPTGLRADYKLRVHTALLSISLEMLQILQPNPDISHMMKGANSKGYGVEAAPHLSMLSQGEVNTSLGR